MRVSTAGGIFKTFLSRIHVRRRWESSHFGLDQTLQPIKQGSYTCFVTADKTCAFYLYVLIFFFTTIRPRRKIRRTPRQIKSLVIPTRNTVAPVPRPRRLIRPTTATSRRPTTTVLRHPRVRGYRCTVPAYPAYPVCTCTIIYTCTRLRRNSCG